MINCFVLPKLTATFYSISCVHHKHSCVRRNFFSFDCAWRKARKGQPWNHNHAVNVDFDDVCRVADAGDIGQRAHHMLVLFVNL